YPDPEGKAKLYRFGGDKQHFHGYIFPEKSKYLVRMCRDNYSIMAVCLTGYHPHVDPKGITPDVHHALPGSEAIAEGCSNTPNVVPAATSDGAPRDTPAKSQQPMALKKSDERLDRMVAHLIRPRRPN
ncbi:MAG: hypothetical protein ACKVG0_07375, partial [Alphaproteobacteria bacterium]